MPRQAAPDGRDVVAEWTELVRAFREGVLDTAVRTVRGWEPSALRTVERTVVGAPPLDGQAMLVAAWLHTAAGLGLVSNGQRDRGTGHLDLAERLVVTFDDHPGGAPSTSTLWARTVALRLQLDGEAEAFERHMARTRAFAPDDPVLRAARGIAAESRAAPWRGTLIRSISGDQAREIEIGAGLREAEVHYRAVLALDPTLAEARLRLGRVLARLGGPSRTAESDACLEAARTAPGGTPDVRYLAWLFTGRAAEVRQQWEAAAEAYGAAAEVVPNAQTAKVAQAHALDRAGRRDAGTALLSGLSPAAADVVDPWWAYEIGSPWLLEAAITAFERRYAIRRSP